MNSILGFNVRTLGVSRDMIASAAFALGGKYILVQDDPDMAARAASMGMKVIYRQSGDETLSLDPASFVAERAKNAPAAAYIHTTNELDSTPELLAWTMEAMRYADNIGRKVVILNYSTHRTADQWNASSGVINHAVRMGHGTGVHLYSTRTSDPQALTWQALKKTIGGTWLVTEFGFAWDAHHGWRGSLTEAQYADFCRAWLPTFAAENMPVLLFSYDHWTANDAGKAHGFGVNDAPEFINAAAALNKQYPITEGTPVPPVTPTGNPVAMRVTATAGLKLRAVPNGEPVLYTMPYNLTVTGYPDTKQRAGSFQWIVVDANGTRGWAAATYLQAVAPAFRLLAPFKKFVITSHFNDPRSYPFAPDKKQQHEGVDGIDALARQYGSDPTIHAGAAGRVVKVGYDERGYGNYCIVDFGDGWRGWYAHCDTVYVSEGQRVASGQIIALMGTTGNTSTAPHCHITLQHIGQGKDGYVVDDVVDPEPFLVHW